MIFDDYEKDKKYRSIFKKNKKKIKARVDLLFEEFHDFIESLEIPRDSVHLQVEIVFDVVRNYFIDINRIKEFHSIDHTNGLKIAAYQTSWLLKFKPIQIKYVDPKHVSRYILLNEHFAFHAMISQLYNTNAINKIDDLAAWVNFSKHLIYHFRFRDCNPQAIELMLEAIDVEATWPKRKKPS